MISHYKELNNVINDFPHIKLSYVKNIYKKVYSANLYYIIPKGRKYFAWFRYFKNKEVCIFLEINRDRSIKNISIKNCCFKNDLCIGKGTILYGTIFKHFNKEFFTVEDIFYNKNKSLHDATLQDKNIIIKDIFENYIKQTYITNNDIIIGLPIITQTRDEIEKYINTLPYGVYCVQHRYLKKNPIYYNEKIINNNRTFIVKPEVTDDIYSLYLKNSENTIELYSTALIPDYKTSVFMNKLFRNIRENENLDLLEESDDDDDFENINTDKFINSVEYKMECQYNNKHRLWTPIKITQNMVNFKDDIIRIEKNNN